MVILKCFFSLVAIAFTTIFFQGDMRFYYKTETCADVSYIAVHEWNLTLKIDGVLILKYKSYEKGKPKAKPLVVKTYAGNWEKLGDTITATFTNYELMLNRKYKLLLKDKFLFSTQNADEFPNVFNLINEGK